MRRSKFVAGMSSALFWSLAGGRAMATGGLDLDRSSEDVNIRVLVGSESARRYRGALHAVELPNGHNGTINTLSLEQYLYGVVPVEMPSSWPYAALEAQAILARTFAMRHRNPRRPYDVIAGSADQEYGGITAETLYANAAVDASAGTIVMYNAMPASIAYMSCCGGHTDDAGRVWGTAYPYLAGVDCPYCASSPMRNWTVRVAWSSIARASGLPGDSVPTRVYLDDLGPGGRPGALRFETGSGSGSITTTRLREISGYRLPGTFVRAVTVEDAGRAVGTSQPGTKAAPTPASDLPAHMAPPKATQPQPRIDSPVRPAPARGRHDRHDAPADDDISLDADGNVIREHGRPVGLNANVAAVVHAHPAADESDFAESSGSGRASSVQLVIVGSGSGHGVGLCQWGARGMAAAGATGQQIVAYYFPHTSWGAADSLP